MDARPFAFAAFALLAGCASPTTEPETQPDPPASASPPPSAEPASPNEEACTAESAALQRAIDAAHGVDTDVAVAVKTPSCGMRTITSGPSKLDAKRLHRIGSVTKTYVAAVVLGLVDEGAIRLDDKISRWVDFVPNGDAITVRMLLDHTSGLFNYTNDAAFRRTSPMRAWTPRELVEVATGNPPYFAPGTSWTYSNTNYILLGLIAESAGKAKIGALVRTRVLAKLGLDATFFEGEEPVVGAMAPGQDASGRDVTNGAHPSGPWAAGAMVATPSDVAVWIEALGSGTFHPPAIQAQLLAPVPTGERNLSYGLGVFLLGKQLTAGGGPAVGHGGDIRGYHTQAFYFPEKKITVVAIVDSDAESSNDVSAAAMKVVFGSGAP
ncbi:MAG: beta-lactamase family protein [Deltaproteobacteria bacterium]|nr:beta-lactamase family protein [Deltaproteobacteria bacterium]